MIVEPVARSGLRYEQGVRLMSGILAVVPDGYTTPPGDTDADIPLQEHQAAVEAESIRTPRVRVTEMSRSIHDAGWSMFVNMVGYMADKTRPEQQAQVDATGR